MIKQFATMKKRILRWGVGTMIFVGFLLACSETLPDDLETRSVAAISAQEVIGLAIAGGGFLLAAKVEKIKG